MTLSQYSPDTWITEYLNIIEYPLPPRYKTKAWAVRTKYGESLGTVAWYSPWRQYAFRPEALTLFEQDCLRDLAQFMEDRTNEHKAKVLRPTGGDTANSDSGDGGGGKADDTADASLRRPDDGTGEADDVAGQRPADTGAD